MVNSKSCKILELGKHDFYYFDTYLSRGGYACGPRSNDRYEEIDLSSDKTLIIGADNQIPLDLVDRRYYDGTFEIINGIGGLCK